MKKTYYIEGMHCKACELLVMQGVENIEGCTIKKIHHTSGAIEVEWSGAEDYPQLKKHIASSGYTLHLSADDVVVEQTPWLEIGSFVLLAVAVTWMLVQMDVFGFMNQLEVDTSLGMIVLLGLVASVSTCLAVTGGVIMGFAELIDDGDGWKTHAKLHGSFHLGRVLGFFALGAVLGGVGNFVSVGLGFASYMNAALAIVFVYLGLNILGAVPSLSRLGFSLPSSLTTKFFSYKNIYLAPVVGALTFFLPCGFTQSIQLMALASGSWYQGGLMMAVFAVGTIPGLLALGMGTSFAKGYAMHGLQKIIAVVLLVFGLFTLWGSANIWGWTTGSSSTPSASVDNVDAGDIEIITLSHNGYQLVPQTTTLKAGKNYEITIIPEKDGMGCMTTVLAPRLDRTVRRVLAGQPLTYTIINASGAYDFVCGSMGMRQGRIVAE